MDIGVVFQCDPPAAELVDRSVRAERLGFSHVWTFDSHLLWQEPFVILGQILARTERVVVGPMVTNPGTRDWSVTASLFATLNEMYGNRTICGIGRGDSALRTLGRPPTTLDELRQCVYEIRELVHGRVARRGDREISFPWVRDGALDIWVAAYGPKALALTGEIADGYILQLADPDIAAWMIAAVRAAAERAGRDPAAVKFCVAAPAYIGDDLAHQREQTRWFGGMVGNHVADIVRRYGSAGATGSAGAAGSAGSAGTAGSAGSVGAAGSAGAAGAVPKALTDYIDGRAGYDYAQHGRAGNTHAAFVPDEIVDRFCVLGPVESHLEKLTALRDLGVDQFAVYLQHDDNDRTLTAYGEKIIPVLSGPRPVEQDRGTIAVDERP